jgi:hypothetical protein
MGEKGDQVSAVAIPARRIRETQADWLRRALVEVGTLPHYILLYELRFEDGRRWSMTTASQRIAELRRDGWPIATEYEKASSDDGPALAIYRLDGPPPSGAERLPEETDAGVRRYSRASSAVTPGSTQGSSARVCWVCASCGAAATCISRRLLAEMARGTCPACGRDVLLRRAD